MPITERTLKKWRKEALRDKKMTEERGLVDESQRHSHENSTRILRMTQELLDQHLMRKK